MFDWPDGTWENSHDAADCLAAIDESSAQIESRTAKPLLRLAISMRAAELSTLLAKTGNDSLDLKQVVDLFPFMRDKVALSCDSVIAENLEVSQGSCEDRDQNLIDSFDKLTSAGPISIMMAELHLEFS